MFNCRKCGKVSKQGESSARTVVEKREAVYQQRDYKVNDRTIHDPGGFGWEIVREELWHKECKDEKEKTET